MRSTLWTPSSSLSSTELSQMSTNDDDIKAIVEVPNNLYFQLIERDDQTAKVPDADGSGSGPTMYGSEYEWDTVNKWAKIDVNFSPISVQTNEIWAFGVNVSWVGVLDSNSPTYRNVFLEFRSDKWGLPFARIGYHISRTTTGTGSAHSINGITYYKADADREITDLEIVGRVWGSSSFNVDCDSIWIASWPERVAQYWVMNKGIPPY